MRLLLVTVVTLAALCGTVQAQAPVLPTSIDVLILPATGDPATVAPIATRATTIGTRNPDGTVTPVAGVCNRAPVTPPTSITNPNTLTFADPYTPGRDCWVPLPTGLPEGTGYRAVAIFVAPDCRPDPAQPPLTPCPSARSAVGVPPFAVVSVTLRPVVPTRLGVLP